MVEWEVLYHLSGQEWIGPTETLTDHLYALFVILTFLSVDGIELPLSDKISSLSVKSYGIYLTHTLVLISAARIIYHVLPSILEYQILFQPILIVAGLGFPILLMNFVERTVARRYYVYIFG
jgi:peptidoglycan/LPS O-acetylase OafA/YrhL